MCVSKFKAHSEQEAMRTCRGREPIFCVSSFTLNLCKALFCLRHACNTGGHSWTHSSQSIPGGGLPCRWGHFCFLSSSERLYLPRAAWHLAPLCPRRDAQATGNNRRAIREARLRLALPLDRRAFRGMGPTPSLAAAFSSLIGANCAIGMLGSSFRVSVGITRVVSMLLWFSDKDQNVSPHK